MKKTHEELLLQQMASSWAEEYGARLREEMLELEQAQPEERITPRLDRRVRQELRLRQVRRYAPGLGMLAACILLFLFVPSLTIFDTGRDTASPSSGGPVTAAEAQSAQAEEELLLDEMDLAVDTADDAGPLEAEATSPDSAPAEYEMLPITFTLPEYFSVSASEQDFDRSIYYLESENLDDVVLTMQITHEAPDHAGLTPIVINGVTAWGQDGPDYSLLTFEKDGIIYVLTCKHDINTLVDLSRYIL